MPFSVGTIALGYTFVLGGGVAKQAGNGGALGSGGGGTVDICRGWRAQCTGNGVSRRLLVGHYPGILMKCGAVCKRGFLDVECTAGQRQHIPSLSPLRSSLCLYLICPMPSNCTQWERIYRRLSSFVKAEAIRRLGVVRRAIVGTRQTSVLSAWIVPHAGRAGLQRRSAINIPGPNGLRTTDHAVFVGFLKGLRWLFIDTTERTAPTG